MPANEAARLPADWHGRSLTSHLDAVRANQLATFHHKRIVVWDLEQLDRVLSAAYDQWRDPRACLPARLLLRSHAAFRAGAGAAMAAQVGEAPCLLRLCLECAGYAAIIGQDQALGELFLRRSDSDEAKRRVRAVFTPTGIRSAVRALDAKLEPAFGTLYESLIDFGAHPNEAMLSAGSRIKRSDRETVIEGAYLVGDSAILDLTLRRTVQVGLWSARVFAKLFPARAAEVAADKVIAELSPFY